ncbi:MAG: alanine racemase, partial [Syntrophorhabdaceae bacterium]|nr:alanine racemase [Syntrophorhabdaceae bacterium]
MMEIEPTSRAMLSINLGFIEYNYRAIKSLLPSHVEILCVIKADAYGHGAVKVAERLKTIGVRYFGIATADEAKELRTSGIDNSLLVMSGILPWDDIMSFSEFNVTPVIYDKNTLKKIIEMDGELEKPLKIHIKFDTGMGRLGFMPHDIPYIIELIKHANNIQIEGIMSHFSASEIRDEYGLNQIKKFQEI